MKHYHCVHAPERTLIVWGSCVSEHALQLDDVRWSKKPSVHILPTCADSGSSSLDDVFLMEELQDSLGQIKYINHPVCSGGVSPLAALRETRFGRPGFPPVLARFLFVLRAVHSNPHQSNQRYSQRPIERARTGSLVITETHLSTFVQDFMLMYSNKSGAAFSMLNAFILLSCPILTCTCCTSLTLGDVLHVFSAT